MTDGRINVKTCRQRHAGSCRSRASPGAASHTNAATEHPGLSTCRETVCSSRYRRAVGYIGIKSQRELIDPATRGRRQRKPCTSLPIQPYTINSTAELRASEIAHADAHPRKAKRRHRADIHIA